MNAEGLEGVFDVGAEVRLSLLDWLLLHLWWHLGCSIAMALGGFLMTISGASKWSAILWWVAFGIWRIRTDIERDALLRISRGEVPVEAAQ